MVVTSDNQKYKNKVKNESWIKCDSCPIWTLVTIESDKSKLEEDTFLCGSCSYRQQVALLDAITSLKTHMENINNDKMKLETNVLKLEKECLEMKEAILKNEKTIEMQMEIIKDLKNKHNDHNRIKKVENSLEVKTKDKTNTNKNRNNEKRTFASIIKDQLNNKEINNVIKFKVENKENLKVLEPVKIRKLVEKNGQYSLKCANEENANKAIKLLEDNNIKSIQNNRIPNLRIRYVDSELSKEDIMNSIKNKNENIKESIENQEVFDIIKINKVQDKNEVILKVSPKIRDQIMKNRGEIYIQYQMCKAEDYIYVHQCYKCQKFGHSFNNCKAEVVTCLYCAGNHRSKECNSKHKKDLYKCANCALNHCSNSSKCTEYRYQVEKLIKNTKYSLN